MRLKSFHFFMSVFIVAIPSGQADECDTALRLPTQSEIEEIVRSELQDGSSRIPALISRLARSKQTEEAKLEQIILALRSNLQLERTVPLFVLETLAKDLVTQTDAKVIRSKIEELVTKRRKVFFKRKEMELASNVENPNRQIMDIASGDFKKISTPSLEIYTYGKPISALDLLNTLPAFDVKWARQTKQSARSKPIAIVYEIQQMPGVFLAFFNDIGGMNDAFQRASMQIEQKKWPLNGMGVLGLVAGGHDLKGVDLAKFWAKAQDSRAMDLSPSLPKFVEASARADSIRRIEAEKDFFEHVILPTLKERGPENVVFLAGASDSGSMRVVSHEMWHGLYFTSSPFRQAVRTYWTQHLQEHEREEFKKMAVLYGYDSNDDELMGNEFQAYMLQRQSLVYGPTEVEQMEKDFVAKQMVKFKEYMMKLGLLFQGV